MEFKDFDGYFSEEQRFASKFKYYLAVHELFDGRLQVMKWYPIRGEMHQDLNYPTDLIYESIHDVRLFLARSYRRLDLQGDKESGVIEYWGKRE